MNNDWFRWSNCIFSTIIPDWHLDHTNFADIENARSSQLIVVNNNLIFTGYGNNNTGGTNMVVVTTNLEGEISDGCLENNPIQMSSAIVTNPVFYAVNPATALVPPDVIDIPVTIHESPFLLQCAFTDTVPKIFILNKNISRWPRLYSNFSVSEDPQETVDRQMQKHINHDRYYDR